MQNNSSDNLNSGFITASGRRFISSAPKDYHYTSFETKNLLKAYSPESITPMLYKKASFVELEPHVIFNRDKMVLSFNIRSGQSGHSYILKDIVELLSAIDSGASICYGKHLEFTHDMSAFSDTSARIISFLKDYFREKQQKDGFSSYSGNSSYAYAYTKGHVKQIELSGHEIDAFFSAAENVWFLNSDFRSRYSEERLLEIVPVFPPIDLTIEKVTSGINFEASPFTMFEGYSYVYFERKRKLHMIPREDCIRIIPFLKFLSARRTENELFIAEKDLPLFSTGLLPVLEEYLNVSSDGFDAPKYSPDIPKFRIYLDMPDPVTITCDVKAAYNPSGISEKVFSIFKAESDTDSGTADTLISVKRDMPLEGKTAKVIAPYFDALDKAKGLLIMKAQSEGDDRLYSFLADTVRVLNGLGEVYLSDSIKSINIISSPRIYLGVSVVSDLLELSIVPEDISLEELDKILRKYDRKKKYYRLKNGDILNLTGEEMNLLFSITDGLGLSSAQILEGHASLPKYRALFLDDLSEKSSEYENTRLVRGGDFKLLMSSFVGMEDNNFSVPKSLENVMRGYQKTGFSWLRTLKANSFGGILADDMGLGKTLQILSLLLSLKEQAISEGRNNKCSLIVCPASLVYNWQHEIKKFTPELKCDLAVGIKADRMRVTSEYEDEGTDVLITSYDLLRRDIEMYKYLHFECMIIDEAQFIKNPGTQISRAVKSVNASFKAALTGTPIENRLSELWSIFDFCMPGYLFSYKNFKESIETPVVTGGDESAMDRLKRMISPFVMRRLKKDVLKDLPDKLEENIVTKMTDSQRELYDTHIRRVRMLIKSKDEDEVKRDRIMILSELTRLRQLCCDPGLIYDNYDGGSAKAELAIEMIKSASESGHKILLFSQFTSMLDRLTLLLNKEQIPFYLLTGSTKKEDRIKMVDAFQEDDTPVFCISLKAGGTGLNLTAADVVIHFDHWWNVAVENQATDRAHRIGQKNVVTVYRLIMKDTIEERIIELQNRKKELADQLLGGDTLGSPSLTKEELLQLLG